VLRHRFAIFLAVLAVIGCCAYAPWVQVDPRYPADAAMLGFAPVWTTNFQHVPGAQVDASTLATHVGLAIVFAALIGLGQAVRRSD
jgi:hypothetical protein